jgi:hypothetical protein
MCTFLFNQGRKASAELVGGEPGKGLQVAKPKIHHLLDDRIVQLALIQVSFSEFYIALMEERLQSPMGIIYGVYGGEGVEIARKNDFRIGREFLHILKDQFDFTHSAFPVGRVQMNNIKIDVLNSHPNQSMMESLRGFLYVIHGIAGSYAGGEAVLFQKYTVAVAITLSIFSQELRAIAIKLLKGYHIWYLLFHPGQPVLFPFSFPGKSIPNIVADDPEVGRCLTMIFVRAGTRKAEDSK